MPRERSDRDGGSPRSSSGPPRLKLSLIHKLKVLALANIIPIMLAIGLGWQWYQGKIIFDTDRLGSQGVLALVVLVLCCGMLAVSSWFILPVARWIRDYPKWHYRNSAAAFWLVPMWIGHVLWFAIWVAMGICAVVSIALIFTGLWVLAEQVGLVGGGESVPEQGAPAETSS